MRNLLRNERVCSQRQRVIVQRVGYRDVERIHTLQSYHAKTCHADSPRTHVRRRWIGTALDVPQDEGHKARHWCWQDPVESWQTTVAEASGPVSYHHPVLGQRGEVSNGKVISQSFYPCLAAPPRPTQRLAKLLHKVKAVHECVVQRRRRDPDDIRLPLVYHDPNLIEISHYTVEQPIRKQ